MNQIFYIQNKYFTSTKVFQYLINFKTLSYIAFKNKNVKEPKKFICPFKNCQKSYALKNILLAHLRTHYGIKPFVCSYCSKSFNEKGNLKTHIRIHTGERPFKCKKCNKGFKALGQLKDHLISHTGFKPFQCPHCLKFYRRKEILKNHVIIHAKDPYFVDNQDKYQEMLDSVKKMKNIMHDLDSSDSISKTNLADNNLNCSISSNEDIKQSLNCSKSTNYSNNNLYSNEEDKITFNKNKFFFLKNESSEDNKENNENKISDKTDSKSDFFIDKEILKDDCCIDWVSSLNDILSSSDFSLKDDNNANSADKNLLNFESFKKTSDNLVQNQIEFSSKFQKHNCFLNNNHTLNDDVNQHNDENDSINDDCCSKMTNLYFQDYNDKVIINELLN